ncbi:hypothetical protein [Curtobacterium sp. BRD11]|uniref:hypothetical protein n=1 Tax=Curtobacterium sp. BRD11 TaxID=2962581 RepID=UPI0028812A88|nr:hypothetical protein [Curtobacterium sp. BRD11]MDT0211223.1 hypothetical protein [Curtobacterium sp. BRD11]
MTELTTDQRVALALTTTLQTSAAVTQAFTALTGNDIAPELSHLAERQAEIQTDIAGRILELSEALAAGKVRIVSEGKLVRALSQVFAEKLTYGRDESGEQPSQLREAQLFLLRLKDEGILQ